MPELIPRCYICDKGIKDEFYLELKETPGPDEFGESRFGFAHYQCIGADKRLEYLKSQEKNGTRRKSAKK